MKRLYNLRGVLTAFAFAAVTLLAAGFPVQGIAQSFTLPPGSAYTNMLSANGGVPVGTGCTIVAGSTDGAGACLTTATSGSIAFSRTYTTAPFCNVVDRTATPVAAYSVSTTAITLSALTSAHNISWNCQTPAY